MQGKMEEVRRLLADGYALEDVESDHGLVEATFRRGSRVVVVKFTPHEAEALLLARVGNLR